MTKRDPDQVIEHRISLQDKQSEQLDDILTVYMIGNILPSLVEVMKDKDAWVALLVLLAGSLGFVFLVDDDLSIAGLIDSFFSQRDQAIAMGIISITPGPWRLFLSPIASFLGLYPDQDTTGGGGGF